ncbi:peptidoglycan binding domain/FecR protein [Novosphingobium sp. Rr 2-17]|uniref:FecR family protein n=1 Tax=Novosphingobium sp. Rr 2-17 TaxID=555793 RepID=UPI000269A503|nr:FecR domain-containing protein [Novosphingobium sp. Rr 2-17]EIZ79184.1 peptidoglycan binding domain/FecR protein [Novosphingobium sp. Rr 2-17]
MAQYDVQRGDNLYTLAMRFLVRSGDYRVVQRLNRIADPRKVPVGRPLRIPRELLKHEPIRGVVYSLHGAVRIDGRAAAAGMAVREGALIATGAKSFVTLMLPDGTAVSLPSQSAVRVQRLRRILLDNHVERLFGIEEGRANASVTPMIDPLSDFRFSTPGAISSVRGTRFRMSYDLHTQHTTSEVLEGKVAFEPAQEQAPQLLAAGYGSATSLPGPVPLLAAPELIAAGKVQSEENIRFALKPLPGADRYHLQIGADAGFLEVLDETEGTSLEEKFSSLPNGTYFVRATAIDANQLEGKPATYAFERRLNRISTSSESSRVGRYRQYLFRWRTPDASDARYRFQFVNVADPSKPLVDETGLTGQSFVITDLPKGSYQWRVMTTQTIEGKSYSKWSDYSELAIEGF